MSLSLVGLNELRVLHSLALLLPSDPAHNSFATQNFFCSGREISQCDHVGLLLILTHNQRKPHLFLRCYPEASTDAVPAYIHPYAYSSRTHKTRYLQSIAQVRVANKHHHHPGPCLRPGLTAVPARAQGFHPESRATGRD